MTAGAGDLAGPTAAEPAVAGGRHQAIWAWPIALSALLAVALQGFHPVHPDVGWLLVLAGRFLDGARLYVDVAEMNPPMSIYLYVPIVALQRLTGLTAPWAVLASVLAATAVSLALAGAVLRSWRPATAPLALAALAGGGLLVLPFATFGQREHFALLAILPLLVAMAARAENRGPALPAAVAIGLCAGLGVAVKPHFALPVALPALVAARSARSWKPLFAPEAIVAGFTAIAYAIHVQVSYPAFIDVWMPILADTYRPSRAPVLERLTDPGTLALLLSSVPVLVALVRRTAPSLALTLAVAGLAFWLAAFEQGKLWNNHFAPALLPMMAAGLLACERLDRAARVAGLVAALGGVWLGISVLTIRGADTTAFADTIRREAPPHPRVHVITPSIAAAHPLTEMVGGVWTNSLHGNWLWQFADHRLRTADPDAPTAERLRRYKDEDRIRFREDLTRADADVILIDRAHEDWLAWALEDPEVATVLARPREGEEPAGVELCLPLRAAAP
ncbi:hypothetical protein [Chthonobacter albigriseus]|uniref:hypothetical protein n=1 Tax=Chthonobacter albigriseus TaxID=1683161 RepID=UPI0015EFBF16|nr:hypothetical protein [Chthonobacter albigriseus]